MAEYESESEEKSESKSGKGSKCIESIASGTHNSSQESYEAEYGEYSPRELPAASSGAGTKHDPSPFSVKGS